MRTRDDLANGELSSGWQPVAVVTLPPVPATPQPVEQNILAETIVAREIKPAGKDTFLIDMGTTLTGWLEVVFPKLEQAREVKIEYSDQLESDGVFVGQGQTDFYLAAGEGVEKFVNKFNYHGFRYVRFSNLPAAPAAGSVKATLVQTGFGDAGSFECSDPDMNRIHDMVQYTSRFLLLHAERSTTAITTKYQVGRFIIIME
jgi:alpha-L-rhamnosidase